ncbi:MAG TPA: VTT domain-containing protein [Chthoniobacterales bacterium]|jgi:uncharacterized membrane protein YdjX (TVP38/TMEM64 family)|nr:VTT domain-containing protein [Chthoniobacterales bacterium]
MLESRRTIYFQLSGIGIVVIGVALLSHFFPMIALIGELQRRVTEMGSWGGIFYPLLFAACNILLLPGGILSIGAGFFFGLWWGFFIVLLGNSIAAGVSFALSHWLGERYLGAKLSRSPMLHVLERAVARDAWKIIFLCQLHPLFPTSLLNYFFGLTRIRFWPYILWTTAGRAPGLFLYAYLGTLGQLGLNLARGRSHPRIVEYWTWGGAFAITVLLFTFLTRTALRAVQEVRPEQKPVGSAVINL